jgi:dTDP-glucose 4,6-dehydratase
LSLDRKIPLHNNGTPIRNWLHADDTAEAVITVIEQNVKNEIYNVCGGFEQSNLDTVTKILTLLEKDIKTSLDFSYNREGQDVRYALDDSKLKSLGWTPKKVFDEELSSIINYYEHNFIW